MGGQTGLNCALDLAREGVLEKYDVELIAASREAIDMAEDRDLFRQAMTDIGLEVPGCKGDEIVVVSRQNNSGTYAYFKKAVLSPSAKKGIIAKGKYRMGTLDMHGSKDVVDLVEKTPCAIGYSGLAYATDHIKTVCVQAYGADSCVSPSVATASDRSYPIARPLFMYTNGQPKGAVKAYLDWILSDAGQCILLKKGYAPVRDVSCN